MIRWFCWFEKYKSTNNYWFIKPSTNSTNQQKIFVENFDEFCLNLLVRLQFTLKFSLNLLKISTNQRKFSTNSTNHQNQRLVDSLIWFRWFCWFVEFVEKINKNKKQRGILESSSTKIKKQQIILDLFWSPVPWSILRGKRWKQTWLTKNDLLKITKPYRESAIWARIYQNGPWTNDLDPKLSKRTVN